MRDKKGSADSVDLREKRLQAVANPRKVGSDGGWSDVMGHIDNVEGEGVSSGRSGQMVVLAKGKIGLKVRIIGGACRKVKVGAKSNSALMNKALVHPRQVRRLPGRGGDS